METQELAKHGLNPLCRNFKHDTVAFGRKSQMIKYYSGDRRLKHVVEFESIDFNILGRTGRQPLRKSNQVVIEDVIPDKKA